MDSLPCETEVRHDTRCEVLDDAVTVRDELLEQRQALGRGEIEREVALVRVRAQVVRAALPPRPVRAQHRAGHAHAIGTHGRLDVDDVGTECRDHARGHRAGPPRAEVEHAKAGERQVALAGRGRRAHGCVRFDATGVLTEARRARWRWWVGVVHTPRPPRHGEGAGGIVDVDAARHEVIALQDVRAAVHRRDGDAQLRREPHALGGGVLRGPLVHDRVPLVPSRLTTGRAGELLVAEQIRSFDEHQEIVELLAAVRTEADVTVLGRFDGRRLERAVHLGDRRLAAQRVHVLGVVPARDRHGLRDGVVDVLAVPRALRATGGSGHRDRGERGRDPLRDAAAGHDRHLVVGAPPRKPTRFGLHDELRRRSRRVRTRAAVWRDRQPDDAGKAHGQIEGVEHVSRERLDHDVGAREQLVDHGIAGHTDDRTRAVMEELEQGAAFVAIGCRAARGPCTPRITGGRLDLHDVGPGVGQQLRAVGTRDADAEVEHP